MKLKDIFKISLFAVVGILILTIASCFTDTNEPNYAEFLRPGEDPGRASYTNYQTLTNSNNDHLTVQGTELLTIYDPDGDDYERGWMTYPTQFPAGTLDLHQVTISADASYIYFYVCLQDRAYDSVASAMESVGFRWTFLGVWFGQTNASPTAGPTGGGTNLQCYSPGDGQGDVIDWMSTRLSTTNVELTYGMGVIGVTATNLGALWDQDYTVTTSLGGNLTYITTNDFLNPTNFYYQTPDEPDISTVFAFKVARVGSLASSGTWKIAMLTYGWEDYGQSTPCPGVNGDLRAITGYPGSYTPGVGGSANIADSKKFMDFLATDITTQSNIAVSGVVDASQFLEITLP